MVSIRLAAILALTSLCVTSCNKSADPSSKPRTGSKADDSKKGDSSVLAFKDDEIGKEFSDDWAAANAKYAGKLFEISGTVMNAHCDTSTNTPIALLQGYKDEEGI
jgi:hypothetical protein